MDKPALGSNVWCFFERHQCFNEAKYVSGIITQISYRLGKNNFVEVQFKPDILRKAFGIDEMTAEKLIIQIFDLDLVDEDLSILNARMKEKLDYKKGTAPIKA